MLIELLFDEGRHGSGLQQVDIVRGHYDLGIVGPRTIGRACLAFQCGVNGSC
jgi:hypothetical protein